MELEKRLLEQAIEAFNEKGAKFTIDDISKALNISKKTVYTVFKDKESLLQAMLEDSFASIKANEQVIYENDTLSTLEKIRAIIIVLPERFKHLDFKQFVTIKERYPKLFKAMQRRIESGWDNTIALLEKGIEEGVIRPIPIPILKAMIEASIEHFLDSDDLAKQGYQYIDCLEGMMDIIMNGISSVPEQGENKI